MNNFIELAFEKSCPHLKWKYYEMPFEKGGGCEILRVSFSGKYECTNDQAYARLMPIIVRAGVEYWNPSKVLLDYSELEFTGGEEFERTYDAVNNDYISTVMVVGKQCRKAMSEIAWPGEDRDIVDNSFFFENMELAIKKLREE